MNFADFMQPGRRDSAIVSLHKTLRIITITTIMNNTYGTSKPPYYKIALLSLFILSLLIAHFIVVFKSRISFSDPIRLFKTGLSVSIPVGQAWQSDTEWQFQENMFSLSSLFPRGSDRPTTWANCRYLLSTETMTPQMRFEQRASGIEAVIVEINQTQIDTLTIDWARIDKSEVHFSMFFGTARLPDNRQLDIEVSQIAGDGELAELVFKHIIETLIFDDSQLELTIDEFRSSFSNRKFFVGFPDNQKKQAFFLIKDAKMSTIGFKMDILEQAKVESIVDEFPEYAEHILRNNQMVR